MNIDPNSSVPIYQQIVKEIQSAVAAGIFQEGERIPSAREMAQRLRVNPNTVQKAYVELVDLGVIESKRGLGRFVKKQGSNSALKQSEQSIIEIFKQGVNLARSSKISERRIRQLFNKALESSANRAGVAS